MKKLLTFLFTMMLILTGCSGSSADSNDALQPQIREAEIGDTITFGSYEQDNDESNGKEPIEWIVLDKKEGRTLVISKYGLDTQPYNEAEEDVTWETCTLRKWLNSTFIDEAFNKQEQSLIATTTVKAEKNPMYSTDPGNDTQDKIFLLSIQETEKYFNTDEG